MSQSQTTAADTSTSEANRDQRNVDLERSVSELETELQILRQLAEYRSMMISRVAHELRTPLTSILGFTEILLSQEQLNQHQRNFCERIQNSAQQLQHTVDQLSDLSRLQFGKADLRTEEFALEDLLPEITRRLARNAKKCGVDFRLQTGPDLPLINSDRGKLRQTLRMLIEDAVGRTKAGTPISVVVEKDERGIVLRLKTEVAQLRNDVTDGHSVTSALALAVATYNLSVLGGTVRATAPESESSDLLIQLPLQLPQD